MIERAADRKRYWGLLAPMCLILLAAYVIPLLGVLFISVSEPKPGFGNYTMILTSPAIGRVAWTTIRICGLTTLLAVLIGYLLAYALARAQGVMRQLMFICVLIPLWTSVLIRTFAWLMMLGENGPLNAGLVWSGLIEQPLPLMHSEIGVIIGMTHYLLPYAVLTILAGMQGIDERLMLAARGLGGGPVTAFRRIYFPLTLPGVFAATILVFVLSLGFYATPIILGGGKVVLIGEYISTQILQIARWGVGTALASLLLIFVLAALALAARSFGHRREFLPG